MSPPVSQPIAPQILPPPLPANNGSSLPPPQQLPVAPHPIVPPPPPPTEASPPVPPSFKQPLPNNVLEAIRNPNAAKQLKRATESSKKPIEDAKAQKEKEIAVEKKWTEYNKLYKNNNSRFIPPNVKEIIVGANKDGITVEELNNLREQFREIALADNTVTATIAAAMEARRGAIEDPKTEEEPEEEPEDDDW